MKAISLIVAAFAAAAAIVLLVPEGNDFALVTLLKHERLEREDGSKIVLVGGSNLGFGVDSASIEAATSCRVVNMGLNGFLGPRFMLAEVKPHLKHSDIVVISLEYDSFYKSVDGTPSDQLIIVKANPAALNHLTWRQRRSVIAAIPYVAQQKVIRLIRVAYGPIKRLLLGPDTQISISAVESLSGLNAYGDVVAHLGLNWTGPRESGLDLTATPIDAEIIGMLSDFTEEMSARGVHVLISYTPVIRYFYDQHRRSLERLHTRMRAAPSLVIPRPPADYVFDEADFFDTVYHLNGRGRAARTERLVGDMQKVLGKRAHCRTRLGLNVRGTARPQRA